MIRLAEDPGELAAVIGHEIGHLQADHARERVTADVARQWGLQLIAFLLNANDIATLHEVSHQGAMNALRRLVTLDVLEERRRDGRVVFVASDVVELLSR